MRTYQIHLIRHAVTAENLEGRYIGHTDTPASEYGLRQIRELIDTYGGYPQADAVFSSPLKRCLQTAALIYPDKKPIVADSLIEYDFGEFENRTADELKDTEAFKTWLAGTSPETPVPFGESQVGFNRRVCTCFAKIVDGIIKAEVKSTAVITHGGVIMSLMAAFALPEASMHEWMTPNGCGYTLRIDPSVWMRGNKLEAFSECPAMPLTEDREREMWDYYPSAEEDDYDITADVLDTSVIDSDNFWK